MDGFGFPPLSSAAAACVFVYLEPKKKNKRAKAKGSPTATAEMRLASVIDRALRKVGSNVHKETLPRSRFSLCLPLHFSMPQWFTPCWVGKFLFASNLGLLSG